MNSILVNLKDPAWWFTVFLVGIVVSILAGFLKDWIGNAFAKVSQTWKARRRVKLERREQLFEALASNETYLILSLVRLTGLLIVSLLLMAMFASLPAVLEIKELMCRAAPEVKACDATSLKLTKIYIAITGGLAMLSNYQASSRFLLVMSGLKRYRERHNLPRVV